MPDTSFAMESDPPVSERLLIIRGFNALWAAVDETYDVTAIDDVFDCSDFKYKVKSGGWPRIVIVDANRSAEEMRTDPEFQHAWGMFMAEERMQPYWLQLSFPEMASTGDRYGNPDGQLVQILVFGQEFFEKVRPRREQPWLRVLASHLKPMFVTDSWFVPHAGNTDLLERLAHNTVLRVNSLDNAVQVVVVLDRIHGGLVANPFRLPLASYVGNPLDTIW